jgi:ATP:ADP antiporter, AAA family
MLFFILFNYTILRDTKDVLVVTAPGSGAEIIPFLKTYVNLPSAILFAVVYSALCNRMPADKVFYLVMTSFLTFFGAFAGIICKYLTYIFSIYFSCIKISLFISFI